MSQIALWSKIVPLSLAFILLSLFSVEAQNDCATALNISGLPYSFSGTTCGAGNNYFPTTLFPVFQIGNVPNTCDPFLQAGSLEGEDAVFTFTPAVDGCIVVSAIGDFGVTAHIYDACPTSGDCLNFILVESTFLATAGVEYYILIDSSPSSNPCVSFTLSVTEPPLIEPNDYCTNAIPLQGDGSNIDATNCGEPDSWTPTGLCTGGDWSSNENGVWYTFNNDQTQDVSIDIFNIQCAGGGSDLQIGVWTNNGTCDLGAESFVNCIVAVGDATLTMTNLPPGDYYLYADGNAGADCTWEFASDELLCDSNPPVPDLIGPFCEGAAIPATLTATPSDAANTIQWYSSASLGAGNLIGTGNSIASNLVITGGAGTYPVFLTELDGDGCESSVATLSIQVVPTPIATPSNDGPACLGETINLAAASVGGNNITYDWTGPNNFPNTQNPQLANITASDAGIYTLIVTVDGCPSLPVTTTVSISSPPDASASNDGPACLGQDINLSGSTTTSGTTTTYDWTGPTNFPNTQNPSLTSITAADAGVYTLIVTVDGCESLPVTTTVSLSAPPDASASNDGPACEGEDITLSGSTTTSGSTIIYDWTGPTDFPNTQNPSLTNIAPTDAGVYTLVVTVDGCPSEPVTTTVNVNPQPTAIPTNTGPQCEGTNITLNGSTDISGATVVYDWTGPNNFPNTQNPVLNNPTSADAGTYSLVVTVDGCPSEAVTTEVIINDQPVASASNTGPECAGQDISLNGSSDIAGTTITYDWTGPNNFPNTQNPTINGATAADAGTYTLIVTVDGCPSEPVTTEVNISTPPDATASNDGPACVGDDINLSGSTSTSGTTITYDWTGPNNFPNTQNPVLSGLAAGDAGTYTLIVTVDGCASEPVTTEVAVSNTPVASASNDGPSCAGTAINLSGSSDISGATVVYDWTGPIDFPNTQNPSIASPTAADAGIYTLIVTVDGCPSDAVTTEVAVNPIPVAMASNDGTACEGNDVQLSGSVDVSGTTVEYNWTGPNNFPNTQNPIIAGVDAADEGIYTLIVTVDGCDSEPVTTEVIMTPIATASAGNNGPLCLGQSLDLSGSVDVSGTVVEYNWTGPNDFSNTQNPNIASFTAADAGVYSLIVTVDGCPTEAVTTTVDLSPPPTADFSLPATICADGTETVTVSYTGSADVNTASFIWDWGGGNATSLGGESYDVSWNNPALVTATVSLTVNENGCPSEQETQNITLDSPLEAPLVTCNSTITSVSFDWDAIAGASDYEIVVTINGTASSPQTTGGALTHIENGLAQGDNVVISVVAIGSNSCGNSSPGGTNCLVQNCPPDNPISTGTLGTVYCEDDAPIPFDATPAGVTVSGDGVVGTSFDPSAANSGTNNLTFEYTDANDCFYSLPFQITVNPKPTADFTVDPASICNDGTAVITVTYTGSASPAATFDWDFDSGLAVSVGTETYEVNWPTAGPKTITLTVTENGCGSDLVSQNIDVIDQADASWNTTSLCASDSPTTLTANAANTGTWSGSGITDFGDGTAEFDPTGLSGDVSITFTTGVAPCDATVTQNVSVTENPDASWTPSTACEIDGPIILSPDVTTGGAWSGDGITDLGDGTASFDPSGIIISASVTYTVGGASCNDTNTQDINVITLVDPAWTSPLLCESSGITLLIPDGSGGGIWTGTGINDLGDGTAEFDPSGLSGPISVTYDPSNPLCPQALTQDINVTDSADPSWTVVDVCASGGPIVLSPDIEFSGTWSGTGITNLLDGNAEFDPTAASGAATVAVTYTVGVPPCEEFSTQNLIIIPPADASWTNQAICESFGIITLIPDGSFTGTWSGLGVNDLGDGTAEFDPAGQDGPVSITYTDGSGICLDELTQAIDVTPIPDASFISDTEICADNSSTILVSYSGTNDPDNTNFVWDWGGGIATPTGATETYEVSWFDIGVATTDISLQVLVNGCASEIESQTITLSLPLTAPTVTCGTSTTSSVSFEWDAIPNATDYELTVFVNSVEGATFNSGGINNYEELGLSQGDEVTLCVTNIGGGICPNEQICASCEAQNCPANPIDIGGLLTSYCENTDPITLIYSPADVVISGNGVTGDGTFDPVASGFTSADGPFILDYAYTDPDGCEYTASHTIDLFPVPTATFTLDTELCNEAPNTATLSYTGSASTAATYTWDFDGGNAIPSGSETYDITWPTAGNYTVSLMVEENDCSSNTETSSITVSDPLTAPIISCGTSTTESVEFVWDPISDATSYVVSVDLNNGSGPGTPQDNGLITNFVVTGLDVGAEVSIIVNAIGNPPCGDGPFTEFSCIAEDCPTIEPSISGFNSSYCEDEGSVDLTFSPAGGVLSGDGTSGSSFDPSGLDGLIQITYTYTDPTSACVYTATESITVNPIPTSDFSLSSTEYCINSGSETTLTYTGTAGASADYDWNFGGAIADPGGNNQGPHTLTWTDPSATGVITLVVTENSCVSEPSTQSVSLSEPLETPIVSCIGSTTSSVTFSWQEVSGAESYTINYGTPANPSSDDTVPFGTNEYTVSGLDVGDEVSISVIASGPDPCGDSQAGISDCTALDCPTLEPSISGLNSSYCEDEGSFDLTLSPAGGVLSGDGTSGSSFDPSGLDGLIQITYTYTDPTSACVYTATESITVNPIPNSDFSLSSTEYCINSGSEITLTYTGSAGASADYDWNFGGAIADPGGNNQGPHTLTWTDPSATGTISLVVTENSCVSELSTQSVSLSEPLDAPIVSCIGSTTTSVTFSWQEVAGADDYSINYSTPANPSSDDTLPFGTNEYTVSGLDVGDEVSISVIASGPDPCGDSQAGTSDCTALDCPTIEPSISGLDPTYCDDAAIVTIIVSPTGGTLSGNGITGDAFNPAGLSGEQTITYNYTDSDSGCSYEASTIVTINPVPLVDFTLSDTEVCADNSSTILVTFTGTAGAGAVYNWDFGTALASPGGTVVGPHTLTWPTGTSGSTTISLSVTEAACTGSPVNQAIDVSAPLATPNVSCIGSTTSSVTFEWTTIPEALGYSIVFDTPSATDQTDDLDASTNTYTISGLSVGEMASISVVALGSDPCGDSEAGTADCTAEDCPTIAPTISGLAASYCADNPSIDLTVDPLGGTLSGDGITGNSFNPSGLSGTYTITYNYTDPTSNCDYTTSETVTVNSVPVADFSLSDTELCTDLNTSITIAFTGTAGPSADYNWDFDGGIAVPGGNTPGPHTVTWPENSTGSVSVILSVVENTCNSETVSQSINLTAPLPSPTVVCTGSTTSSVTFEWDPIATATGYSIIYNTPSETDVADSLDPLTTSYTVSGLDVGEQADISVIALGPSPCGNSAAGISNCIALDCPTVNLDLTGLANSYCLGDPIVDLTVEPVGAILSGAGISGTTFDPSSSDLIIGINTLNLDFTDPATDCTYNLPLSVEIFDIPTAEFTLDATEICANGNNFVQLNYTGTATAAATFTWDFAGANATPSAGLENYSLSWDSGDGDVTIRLIVEENGCPSDPVDITINLDAPLIAANVSCIGSTTSSVTFSWDAVANADDYAIAYTIDAGPINTDLISATEYTVTGLSVNEMVVITVVPNSTNSCPSGPGATADCTAQDCPTIEPSIDGFSGPYCLDNDPIILVVSPTGGTISGPGISDDGISINFDAAAAGVGTHTINYDYIDPTSLCNYNYSTTVTVNEIPTADFNLSSNSICIGGADAVISYSGTASAGAIYTWDFDGGIADPATGQGPHTINWADAGTYTIQLQVEENGCISAPFSLEIDVAAPLATPAVNCTESTLNSISFGWDAIDGVSDYEVTISGDAGPLTDTISTTSYEVTGLAEGANVTISVIAIGTAPCGNSDPGSTSCIAQNCPPLSIDITNIDGSYCLSDAATIPEASIPGGIFSIDSSPITEVDPASLGVGTYTIEYNYIDDQGCPYGASTTVEILAEPEAIIEADSQICTNDPLTINFIGTASPDALFNWDFGTATVLSGSDSGPYEVAWSTAGTQTISLSIDDNGCTDNTELEIEVGNLTVETIGDLTISLGESISLNTTAESSTNSTPISFDWTDTFGIIDGSTEQDPIVSPLETTTYTVTALDALGCPASDQVTITVLTENLILVPTAFSPNGDGENDIFRAVGLGITELEWNVYNRWGQKVYTNKTTDLLEGWDGTFKGELQEIGVYVYSITVSYIDGEEKVEKGNITLIR